MEQIPFRKDKEPGIAVDAVVRIVEKESKSDVDFLAEAHGFYDSSYKTPQEFVVKRIINRGGVETAVLVDKAHASLSQDEIQKIISKQYSVTTPPHLGGVTSEEVAGSLKDQYEEASPLRKVMSGEMVDDAMVYFCPTWYLEPVKTLVTADEFARRRAEREKRKDQ